MILHNFIRIQFINNQLWHKLYQFFCKFFIDTNFEKFKREALTCKHLILLQDKNNNIIGFSFIGYFKIYIKEDIFIIWNGPTIIDKKITSTRRVFCKCLALYGAALSVNISKEIYFFMMSEGLDSYLFGINNFPLFYPNPDYSTPEKEHVLINYLGKLFGKGDYNIKSQTIQYESGEGLVRESTIPISSEKRKYYNFFNSRLSKGEYLCTIAPMNSSFFAKHLIESKLQPFDNQLSLLTRKILSNL